MLSGEIWIAERAIPTTRNERPQDFNEGTIKMIPGVPETFISADLVNEAKTKKPTIQLNFLISLRVLRRFLITR